MPLKNLFKRSAPLVPYAPLNASAADQAFHDASVVGGSVYIADNDDNSQEIIVEHELAEMNDNGSFIEASPSIRKAGFWFPSSYSVMPAHNRSKSNSSSIFSSDSQASSDIDATPTTNHRAVFSESEPFNISRESFDSYRRSFDISGRSSISSYSASTVSSRSASRQDWPMSREERRKADWPEEFERFEDVTLSIMQQRIEADSGKKRSFLARFLVDGRATSWKQEEEEQQTSPQRSLGISFPRRFSENLEDEQGSELKSLMSPIAAQFPAEDVNEAIPTPPEAARTAHE